LLIDNTLSWLMPVKGEKTAIIDQLGTPVRHQMYTHPSLGYAHVCHKTQGSYVGLGDKAGLLGQELLHACMQQQQPTSPSLSTCVVS
jgi:hypothetical protein